MDEQKKFFPIPGYEGFYEISRSGEVRSMPRLIVGERRIVNVAGTIMHPTKQIMSYKVVLKKDGKRKCFTVKKLIERTFYS